MAIVNSIRKQIQGAGIPNWGAPTGINPTPGNQSVGISLSTGSAQNNALTLSPGLSRGKFRIRIYSLGGTNPTIIARAYLYDGTSAVDVMLPESTIAPTLTTSPGPCGMDFLREFVTEITATSLCVITTLAGTSPTAQMDLECYGPQ
jgi:hypothetical protein